LETLGHRAGDAILVRIAGEVSTQVRRNELFSRLGGDEFAILISAKSEDEVVGLAGRIVHAIAQIPFQFGPRRMRVTSSLGVAIYPNHASNTEELIAHADAAMYQAKESGKHAWRIYRPDRGSEKKMVEHLAWNERIQNALDEQL